MRKDYQNSLVADIHVSVCFIKIKEKFYKCLFNREVSRADLSILIVRAKSKAKARIAKLSCSNCCNVSGVGHVNLVSRALNPASRQFEILK